MPAFGSRCGQFSHFWHGGRYFLTLIQYSGAGGTNQNITNASPRSSLRPTLPTPPDTMDGFWDAGIRNPGCPVESHSPPPQAIEWAEVTRVYLQKQIRSCLECRPIARASRLLICFPSQRLDASILWIGWVGLKPIHIFD